MSPLEIVYCGAFLIIAGLSATAIFVPQLRPNWKGSQTRIGPLACCGAALFFGSIPVLIAWADAVPANKAVWLALPMGIGFVFSGFGYAADFKHEPQRQSRLVAIGAVLIVLLIFAPALLHSLID